MEPGIARRIILLASVGVLLVVPSDLRSSGVGDYGINRLILVCELNAANANDEALQGFKRQRDLVKQQQTERDRARETAVLRQLEANASRTAEVLKSVKAIQQYLQKNPCK